MHVVRADRGYAHRELGVPEASMSGCNRCGTRSPTAGACPIVFTPAVKSSALNETRFSPCQPAVPIDVFGFGLLFDQVVPLTLGAVAAVIALAPNQRSELAALISSAHLCQPAAEQPCEPTW